MTVKELLEKTAASVFIIDGKDRYPVTPWNIIYNAFRDCVIDCIEPSADNNGVEITLKTQLVKKEG